MAHPKRRHSHSRTKKRQSHDKLRTVTLSKCSNCSASVKPHAVCPKCGFYKGKRVVTIKVKEKKGKGEEK